jgi:hypothetical protein
MDGQKPPFFVFQKIRTPRARVQRALVKCLNANKWLIEVEGGASIIQHPTSYIHLLTSDFLLM